MKITTPESAVRVPFQLDGRIMLSNKHVETVHLCLQPGEVLPAHINDFNVERMILHTSDGGITPRRVLFFEC